MAVRRGGGLFRIGSPYMSDLAENGQEGEVLYFPSEPEGDCIVADNWGEYFCRDADGRWASLDREGPYPETWENVCRDMPLTIYRPVKVLE